MKSAVASGISAALFATACLAGNLEDGIRQHDRKEFAKAVAAFGKAAANGDVEAQRRLGFMYYHGEGVVQDNKRAVALFEKAATGGDLHSAHNLGTMYEYGMGVDQSDRRAAHWFLVAAELGDPQSQFSTSVMYYKGQGVAQDRLEAAKWWTVAMSHGPAWEQRFRPSVASAEAKLTPEENAEAKRRAEQWLKAREARK